MYEPGQVVEVLRATESWLPAKYEARAESEVTKNGLVQWHYIRWDHNDEVDRVQDWRVRLPSQPKAG